MEAYSILWHLQVKACLWVKSKGVLTFSPEFSGGIGGSPSLHCLSLSLWAGQGVMEMCSLLWRLNTQKSTADFIHVSPTDWCCLVFISQSHSKTFLHLVACVTAHCHCFPKVCASSLVEPLEPLLQFWILQCPSGFWRDPKSENVIFAYCHFT